MKRNQFTAFMGLQSLLIGIFIKSQFYSIIQDDQSNRMIHALYQAEQMPFTTMMILFGSFAVIVGVIDPPNHWVITLFLSLLSGVWLSYFIAFFCMDLHFDRPIKLSTVLMFCFFAQIAAESFFSGWNAKRNKPK